MAIATGLLEGLRDIPGTGSPPGDLVGAVNRLFEANAFCCV